MLKAITKSFVPGDRTVYHGFRKAFIKNNKLSLEARFLLVLLFTYKGKNENCGPSQGTLGKDMGCSRRTVRKYLRELEKNGFLKITRKGIGSSLLYSPNYLPIQKAKSKPTKTTTHQPTQGLTALSIDSKNIVNELLKIRRDYVTE